MEIVDNRKVNAEGEAKPELLDEFDQFKPTLAGFQPRFDAVLLREMKLSPESVIQIPDAFGEQCLYCEVIASSNESIAVGETARILKGTGTTIPFSDTEPGQRYFTVNALDIIGVWGKR